MGGGGMGKKTPAVGGFEQWQFWWEYNKDRYRDHTRNPISDKTRNATTDALLSVLSEDDLDIVDSALIALAKVAPLDRRGEIRRELEKALSSRLVSVEQSAILALGILGDRDATIHLREILNDTEKGREILGRSSCRDIPRSFAALSLGRLGDAHSLNSLFRLVSDPSTPQDVAMCSVLALGSYKQHREEIVAFLRDRLRVAQQDPDLRAQIPIALSRLGSLASRAVPELIRIGESKKVDVSVGESCVIAVGRLASFDDQRAMSYLMDEIGKGRMQQRRHFAIQAIANMALAGITDPASARPAEGKAEQRRWDKQYKKMTDVLLREIRAPRKRSHQPWAALALARIARSLSESHPDRVAWSALLDHEFSANNNPSTKGAMAIALGLMNAKSSEPTLLAEIRDTRSHDLVGNLSLALGLMGSSAGKAEIGSRAFASTDHRLALRGIQAVGHYRDPKDIPGLLEALSNAETLNRIGALAEALGAAGTEDTIDLLLKRLGNNARPGLDRAFSAVAIGIIADRSDRPWSSGLVEAMNYRIVSGSLYELADLW